MNLSEIKTLLESAPTYQKQLSLFSSFLKKEDLLNILYVIEDQSGTKIARIHAVGAPNHLTQILQNTVSVPLNQISFPVENTPVLRRVYQENRRIYFKKVPELVAGLLPSIRQIDLILRQLGITDVAVLPLAQKPADHPDAMLVVLGPLTKDQLDYLREAVTVFSNIAQA